MNVDSQHARTARRLLRPRRSSRRAIARLVREARSARAVPQPGDVRRRTSAACCTTVLGVQRCAGAGRGAGRRSSSRSRPGCGSRCCSRTSPRRWPRGAARRRPTRCARRASDVHAKKLREPQRRDATSRPSRPATLRKGDVVLVEAGDIDSRPTARSSRASRRSTRARSPARARRCIRESGGDRSAVTGGTRVLSDWLVVRVTQPPGETFLDRMIAHGRGREAQKTPNEIALDILLAALTIIFLLATATLLPFSQYASQAPGSGTAVTVTVLVALLVCLIPTTIGGLLSAIGIAGMDRMIQANVIATSGRAVEAAGDVDVLLLDKTGTITLGNRQATAFHPAPGVDGARARRRRAARLARRRDARGPQHRRARQGEVRAARARRRTSCAHTFVPFSRADAHERRRPRRPPASARAPPTRSSSSSRRRAARCPAEVARRRRRRSRARGATPLVVADGARACSASIELQGHRQGRHPRALRRAARRWASRP